MSENTLKAAVTEFNRVHDAWVADLNAPIPPHTYWDALEELQEVFAGSEIPVSCQELALCVSKLGEQRLIYEMSDRAEPQDAFWQARSDLESARARMNRKIVVSRESVQTLHKQDVPHAQIAKIWGLMDDFGNPRLDYVEQELKHPGSIINDKYVHPDDAKKEQELKDSRERVQKNIAKLATEAGAAKVLDEKKPPESSYQLWLEEVPLWQAARILGQEEAFTKKEWEMFDASISDEKSEEGEYANWSDDELRSALKEQNILRGNPKRETMIARLREHQEEMDSQEPEISQETAGEELQPV